MYYFDVGLIDELTTHYSKSNAEESHVAKIEHCLEKSIHSFKEEKHMYSNKNNDKSTMQRENTMSIVTY